MVSFIVDTSGKKTHAVVPINEWERINVESYFNSINMIPYPEKHIANTIDFLKGINNLPINDWKVAYEKYFDYYNKLDVVDFIILYLFRAGHFSTMFDEEVEHADRMDDYDLFHNHFLINTMVILKKDGSKIDWDLYTSIRDKIGFLSEQEFLILFHSKLKFEDESIENFKFKYKRMHRNAERDRLFVYDLNILLMDDSVHIRKEDVFEDLLEDVSKYLANHLYNGNISQVYRASKEAQDRIQYICM